MDKSVIKVNLEEQRTWFTGQETEEQQKRNSYWKLLRMARSEYGPSAFDEYQSQPFDAWILETYGVKMFYEGTNIAGHFEIVDEHKYLLLLLKYGDK